MNKPTERDFNLSMWPQKESARLKRIEQFLFELGKASIANCVNKENSR